MFCDLAGIAGTLLHSVYRSKNGILAMKYLIYLFWIIIVILGVAFVVINSHTVLLNYYVGQTQIYFPLLLLIELVIGAILGIIAMLPVIIRLKAGNHKLRYAFKQSEQELKNLRTMPIKDSHSC